MKVLVACEFSGIVRDAFLARGHDAVSCDIIATEVPGPHIMDDVFWHLEGWDLIIAHPPCTYLAASGARWWKDRVEEQGQALDFVRMLLAAPCDRIAVENPISKISTAIRKPDQIIHPWQFGHYESKATCLWLKGLPDLAATNIVYPANETCHRMSPGSERQKNRSRTFPGIAQAMAEQWVEDRYRK